MMTIDEVLVAGAPPIMAILRGVRPDAVVAIGAALVAAGIRLIEVPFNSPEPEASIAALSASFGGEAVIGGGTILSIEMVDRLAAAGGRVAVSPNTDATVIARALACGMVPMPGIATPTEAFAAIAAGATRLKLFPGAAFGPAYLVAVREVVPPSVRLWAVGGADASNLANWLACGAEGIGVGGGLYGVDDTPDIVAAKASTLVEAWRRVKG